MKKNTVDDTIPERDLHYQCVEDADMLKIQTALWKKGRQLYYRRGYHWWLTGFVLGEYSKPKDLEMDIEITLKDMQMRNIFLDALHKVGYTMSDIDVQGNRVWIHYVKPHTKQPVTRTKWVSVIKQMENKRNCRIYNKLARNYANAYEIIVALKERYPRVYKKMEELGNKRISNPEERNEEI